MLRTALLFASTYAYTEDLVCPTYGETYPTRDYYYGSSYGSSRPPSCAGCNAGDDVYLFQGSYYCKACPAGHYQAEEVSKYDWFNDHCVPCEKGTYASGNGNSACSDCPNNDPEKTGAKTCSDIPYAALIALYVVAGCVGLFLLLYFRELLWVCLLATCDANNETTGITVKPSQQVELTDPAAPIIATVAGITIVECSVAPAPAGPSHAMFCAFCGSSNPSVALFCTSCGKARAE
jgi:hypothetical protein